MKQDGNQWWMWGQQFFKTRAISTCLYTDNKDPLERENLLGERKRKIPRAISSRRQEKKGSWQNRDVGIW